VSVRGASHADTMICRNCGTEIADKALICYRCGAPTSSPEPRVKPRPRRSALQHVVVLVALLLLVAAGLFLGQAGQVRLPPLVSYAVAALAALVLFVRIWRRRRR
jgi:hypothetical protein